MADDHPSSIYADNYICLLKPRELQQFMTSLHALRVLVETIRDTPPVIALEGEFRVRGAEDMISLMNCIVADCCIIGAGWVYCVEHLETLARMIPTDSPAERDGLLQAVRNVEASLPTTV